MVSVTTEMEYSNYSTIHEKNPDCFGLGQLYGLLPSKAHGIISEPDCFAAVESRPPEALVT